jgi:hypothetical protein
VAAEQQQKRSLFLLFLADTGAKPQVTDGSLDVARGRRWPTQALRAARVYRIS